MATAAQKKAHASYLKNRAKKLAYMRAYYKRNKAKRKAYQKKYYRRTKKSGPLYLKGKGKGRRPLFARVSAHNRRNGKFSKGASGSQKGRKPASSGRAFKPVKRVRKSTRRTSRKAA